MVKKIKKTSFESKYSSKTPDKRGVVSYTDEENKIWNELITRQLKVIEGRACDEFVLGLNKLDLPLNKIPQLHEVSEVLLQNTGWQLEPVPSLITFKEFFEKLSNRIFPVATFIRKREDLEYLQEPDLFHEIFGHCPMLLNSKFAEFTEEFGKLALQANVDEEEYLGRLYWFTAEFGLLITQNGLRAYGGGILSSPSETILCLENKNSKRENFDLLNLLRTPYRIDMVQPIYFKINNFDELLGFVNKGLYNCIQIARDMGMHKPLFT